MTSRTIIENASESHTRARRRLTVRGVVQGVGFRPFVYRLAHEMALVGFVQNDGGGARLELEGPPSIMDAFESRLVAELPEGSRIDAMDRLDLTPLSDERFEIRKSAAAAERQMSLAPDRATCDACLRELADPTDRRYRYPFINCTHCGPRYTITRALPYDRPATTMARFAMCDGCRREYENPLDRRYHAQPIACPACGPSVWLEANGETIETDALTRAVERLKNGQIVAIKGLGGFHLAVDAENEAAVRRLRELKHRPRKPLALMAKDLDTARRLIHLGIEGEALLASPAAPIVLAPARRDASLASWIADGVGDLGVMLPYTPLHHLLFQGGLDLLVMTSGNAPSEPITTDNDDARERLGADASLMHDRDIEVANDDSVIRTTKAGPALVRRSRGFVPGVIGAEHLPGRSVLALGAFLKVTVSVLQRGQLITGRHLGDLDNARAEDAFTAEVDRMLAFSRFEPDAVAVDLHPDLFSASYAAERFPGGPLVRVQHHHAHMAAVMVEHGVSIDEDVVGIVLDGFGHGTDGAVWGGEVLTGGYGGFERAAHLRYVPLPGGDRAALEPRRMGVSFLLDADVAGDVEAKLFDEDIAEVAASSALSPLTSSCGRLFDGAAHLLGIAPEQQDYEGEAAMRLEALANPDIDDGYPLPLHGDALDTRELIRALVVDSACPEVRAARFINGLADGLIRAAVTQNRPTVVLSGGCMLNRLLLSRLSTKLRHSGLKVLLPMQLPPGDGGLSAGQAAVAAASIKGRV